ncbi:MAG: hypothetical protein HC895_16485 [Leptolyngbyaceae cyanobacterium SM1_3_5]|nr:hypothetical protein [Leptolyngbyaceae cyanobacterium SM1_3_5]
MQAIALPLQIRQLLHLRFKLLDPADFFGEAIEVFLNFGKLLGGGLLFALEGLKLLKFLCRALLLLL